MRVYHLPTVHPQGEYWIEHDYTQCVFDWCDEGHNRMAIQMGAPAQSLKNKDLRIDDQLASMLTPWGLDPKDFAGREYDTRPALQRAKREHAESKGYRIGELEDDQLTDAYHYNIFRMSPSVLLGASMCQCNECAHIRKIQRNAFTIISRSGQKEVKAMLSLMASEVRSGCMKVKTVNSLPTGSG